MIDAPTNEAHDDRRRARGISAELDTLRRMLGLSIAEMGEVCADGDKAVSEKTVRRWLSGEVVPPPDVMVSLKTLDARLRDMAETLPDRVRSNGYTGIVALERFREGVTPDGYTQGLHTGSHAIYTGLAARSLEKAGIPYIIDWAGNLN